MRQRKKAEEAHLGAGALLATALGSAALVIAVGGALTWWLVGVRPVQLAERPVAGGMATQTAASSVEVPSPTAGWLIGPTAAPQEAGTWLTADGFAGLGPTTAAVSLVVFLDYNCPNSRQFALEIMPWLRETWLQQGLITLVLRDFAVLGESSVRAAVAAHCAGEQGRYVAYHDRLFTAQGAHRDPFGDEQLVGYATELSLDAEAFAACLTSGRYRSRVEASTRYGYEQGFEGTPTYIINGRRVAGAIERERWNELFEAYAQGVATATAGGEGSKRP